MTSQFLDGLIQKQAPSEHLPEFTLMFVRDAI